jgi:hypothetical protein
MMPRLRPVLNLVGVRPMARQRGQLVDTVADLLAREAQFVELLKVEPELRAGAEPVAKPQRGVGRHAALAIDDGGDPVHRHVDLARQFRGRDAEFLELFGEVLAGMNGSSCHDVPPNDNRQSRH